jgi:tRNA-(ms[2]io[6]A)-hydroxylase
MTATPDLGPLLAFLRQRSPAAWVAHAVGNLDSLLLDHAVLEFKAAQQAQKLIWKYGIASRQSSLRTTAAFRSRLCAQLSRLAREELRHFEQVVGLIERRGGTFVAISPSRYAGGLHALARASEPGALIDALIIGAIIEARSCERFYSLLEPLQEIDTELATFYASLLRSEARHFEGYLALAEGVADAPVADRVNAFLQRDAQLIESPDAEFRFHSGPPAATV